jgi:hypothetical protein
METILAVAKRGKSDFRSGGQLIAKQIGIGISPKNRVEPL